MSSQSAETEDISLGEFLRKTRNEHGLNLAAVVKKTRISLKNLRAIEEDDYDALPAEAFAQGFYAIYAEILLLDPQRVLQMYAEERPNKSQSTLYSTTPRSELVSQVNNMAQRRSSMTFFYLVLILLLLLIFGAFLCWYLSWNPAKYLSHKLRSLQKTPPYIEQVLGPTAIPDIQKSRPKIIPSTSSKQVPSSPPLTTIILAAPDIYNETFSLQISETSRQ